jgi:hypothetical protein
LTPNFKTFIAFGVYREENLLDSILWCQRLKNLSAKRTNPFGATKFNTKVWKAKNSKLLVVHNLDPSFATPRKNDF